MIRRFSQYELDWIGRLADDMVSAKQGQNPSTTIAPGIPFYERMKLGLMGEYAVADLLGLEINDKVLVNGDGDIADLFYRGKTIQVKTSFTANGHLAYPRKDMLKADIIVFCVKVAEDTIRICGYVTQAMWVANENMADLGAGPRWAISQDRLCPFQELLAPWWLAA